MVFVVDLAVPQPRDIGVQAILLIFDQNGLSCPKAVSCKAVTRLQPLPSTVNLPTRIAVPQPRDIGVQAIPSSRGERGRER